MRRARPPVPRPLQLSVSRRQICSRSPGHSSTPTYASSCARGPGFTTGSGHREDTGPFNLSDSHDSSTPHTPEDLSLAGLGLNLCWGQGHWRPLWPLPGGTSPHHTPEVNGAPVQTEGWQHELETGAGCSTASRPYTPGPHACGVPLTKSPFTKGRTLAWGAAKQLDRLVAEAG